MNAGERYAKLMDVAREGSSEKRRELLREVTDMFFDSADSRSPIETNLFGDLLGKVAFELDREVRRELATRFSKGDAPHALAVRLAHDDIEVAAPILRHSKALTDSDLVHLVETKGDSHRMVVTQREEVSEAVSDALVTHGGDNVVAALVGNAGARFRDDTFDRIMERAEANPELRQPVIRAPAIAPHHLNQLYMLVEGPMRKEILERYSKFSPEQIEQALERAKTRVDIIHSALPADFETASRDVAALRGKGALTPAILPTMWRNKQTTQMTIALADMVGVDFRSIAQIVGRKDIDALAMLCRAAGFDRSLFVTLAVLLLGEAGMGEAAKLGAMYNDVPPDAAQRAVRFMKVRQASAKAA
jgi:uncharacterized protein (DUF2336 family)